MNDDLELLRTTIPGPQSLACAARLRARESHNVTFFSDRFPVFWESASGANVTDVDGNRYVDLTAAFGVANVGHSNPHVVAAVRAQAERLMHGMGDVHPTEVKTALLERLPTILPPGLDTTFLATTGSEAVEAALKSAILATGKHAFATFRGAYHGLSLGALSVSGIPMFREPFARVVAGGTLLLEYPNGGDARAALEGIRTALQSRDDLAAIVVEPLQGRGGVLVPPPGFLAGLRALCDERDMLLIFDEIYTGFGRTGAWFAALHEGVTPDIICIGKAMGGGFPISATVARRDVMDAWPLSQGEALHTSTYLGNPTGCAAALAVIDELERLNLPDRAHDLDAYVAALLEPLRSHPNVRDVRGRGMMWGVELGDAALAERVVVDCLARGVILLQAGTAGNVISVTPPLVISEAQLNRAIAILTDAVRA